MPEHIFGIVQAYIYHADNIEGNDDMYIALFILIAAVCAVFYKGVRIVRPAQRGLVESFGRYKRFVGPGFHWNMPLFRKLYIISISEQMLDVEPQLTITSDNLNAVIDARVYIKVRPDEDSVKAALYNTDDYYIQTMNLAKVALKKIIGKMPLRKLASERELISTELRRLLDVGTANWGIDIIKAELNEIEFPRDVQDAMNKIVKAENEKKAAADFASAAEKVADGFKHAEIKKAEGQKQAKILAAEGEAKAIRVICDAAQQYFSGSAQLLKVLEVSETVLKNSVNEAAPGSSRLHKALGDVSVLPDVCEHTGTK